MAVNKDKNEGKWFHRKWTLPKVKSSAKVKKSSSFSHIFRKSSIESSDDFTEESLRYSLSADGDFISDSDRRTTNSVKETNGLLKSFKRHLNGLICVVSGKVSYNEMSSKNIVVLSNETLLNNQQLKEQLRSATMMPSPTFFRSPLNIQPLSSDTFESAGTDSETEYVLNRPPKCQCRRCLSDSDSFLETDEEYVPESPINTSSSINSSSHIDQLSKYGWYWGPLTQDEAKENLQDKPDGSFLVRDSSSENYLFTLSFRSLGKTCHTRIERNKGLFSLYTQPEQEFPNIPDLIIYSMISSQTSVLSYSRPRSPIDPAYPLRLTNPISRFNKVRSLQYLCRFVIRSSVRYDKIESLPLPASLQTFVKEGQF